MKRVQAYGRSVAGKNTPYKDYAAARSSRAAYRSTGNRYVPRKLMWA
jgi:hypothetical protein